MFHMLGRNGQIKRAIERLRGESFFATPRDLDHVSKKGLPEFLLGFSICDPDLRASFLLERNSDLFAKTEFVRVHGPINQKHAGWLSRLPNLRLAQFDDIASECLEALQCSPELQHLTLLKSELTAEHLSVMQGLSHIQSIILVRCQAKTADVVSIRDHMPGLVIGYAAKGADPFPPAILPRQGEPRKTRAALERMHRALKDVKAENEFSEPITPEQLKTIEQRIGIAVPKDLLTIFNRHAGQPDTSDDLMTLCPFLKPAQVVRTFDFELDYGWGEFFWWKYRDTAGHYHRLLLPFMAEDADAVHLNVLTGQVVETRATTGSVVSKNLADFLNAISVRIEQGEFIGEGCILLNDCVFDLQDEGCPDFSGF